MHSDKSRWVCAFLALLFSCGPALATSPPTHGRGYCPANGAACDGHDRGYCLARPCDGNDPGPSIRPAVNSGFMTVSNDPGLSGIRDLLVAQSAADSAEPPPPFFERKRRGVFMTDATEDGTPFSADNGVIRLSPFVKELIACAIAFSVLAAYFLLGGPIPAKRSTRSASPLRLAPTASPGVTQDVDRNVASQPSARSASELPHVAEDAAWSQLVVACSGDAARAGAVINGVVAADPSLSTHSREALVRALAAVKRI